MRVTPLEIRQKSFDKKMRGYDKEAVDSFLLSLSHEWERLVDENKQTKQQFEQSQQEVKKLREVEESLFKTLKTAEDTGANLVEQASKSAELTLKEAQMNAEAILSDARSQVKDMFDEADEHVKHVLSGLENEVRNIKDDLKSAENLKYSAVRELKALADEIMDKTTKISNRKVEVSIPKKDILKPSISQVGALPDTQPAEVAKKLTDNETTHVSKEITNKQNSKIDEQPSKQEINFEVNTSFEEPKIEKILEDNKDKKKGGSFFDQIT